MPTLSDDDDSQAVAPATGPEGQPQPPGTPPSSRRKGGLAAVTEDEGGRPAGFVKAEEIMQALKEKKRKRRQERIQKFKVPAGP